MNESSATLRIVAFYVTTFAVMGIYMPFWPLWLKDRGLGEREIGTIISVGICVRVLTPWVAQRIDEIGRARVTAVVLCTASSISFALFEFASGFVSLLTVSVLLGVSFMMIYPLTDSLAARAAGERYGRLRLWGSVSFMLVNVGAGIALERYGAPWLYSAILCALIASIACAALLPEPAPTNRASAVKRPLRAVLENRRFVCFAAGAGLIQASHAGLYSFGSIHWQSLGIDEFTIGWLWATGVIVEIVLFHCSAQVTRLFEPRNLALLGGIAAVVRWVLTSRVTSEVPLFCVQTLHAVSFAATHLAVVTHIRRHLPAELSVTAISIYAAIGTGVGMAASTFSAGVWYARHGAQMFVFMSAIAVIGAATVCVSRRLRTDDTTPTACG